MALKFDEIGDWSQLKLEIVRDYAAEYSKILSKQPLLRHSYVDAFAGAGVHVLRRTGDLVPGSPLNALAVRPRFKEVHLIDLDGAKVRNLKELTKDEPDLSIYEGDCNEILLQQVFPRIRYEDFRRGLCLLDPNGLHLDWKVLAHAGAMRSIEIFLNFPVMDINRNALWLKPEKVDPDDIARMNAFWGDESWRTVAYQSQGKLFEEAEAIKVRGNARIVAGFRERLKNVAGFKFVPEPIAMKNSTRATVYYLFFASNNETGAKVASHLFKTRRQQAPLT